MAYYIKGSGRYYYGKVTYDYLSALVLLDEAKRTMPGENWVIMPCKVA